MIQLIINRSKIAINLFLLIFFIIAIAIIAVPKNTLATTYGEGAYGACPYETGCNKDGSPAPAPSPSPTPTTDNTNSSSVSTTEPTTPTTTTTSNNLSPDSITTFSTQYPTFQGHTVPYATVIIEIDGIPVEVTADANGDWQYKVTNPLDFGEHTIKITIKDKDSNETISENSYKINIAEKTETVNNETTSPRNHRTWTIIGIIALILSALIFLLIFLARRRRKKHRNY